MAATKKSNSNDKDGLSSNQDHFARLVAEGKSLTDAYLESHPGIAPDSARTAGSRMMKSPEIVNRAQQYRDDIHAAFVSQAAYSREMALREAHEALEMARDQAAPMAMRGLIELKCKIANIFEAEEENPEDDSPEKIDERLAKIIAKVKEHKLAAEPDKPLPETPVKYALAGKPVTPKPRGMAGNGIDYAKRAAERAAARKGKQ